MTVGHQYAPFVKLLIFSKLAEILEWYKFKNILLVPDFVNPALRELVMRLRNTVWSFIGLICGIRYTANVDLDWIPIMGNHEPGGSSL